MDGLGDRGGAGCRRAVNTRASQTILCGGWAISIFFGGRLAYVDGARVIREFSV